MQALKNFSLRAPGRVIKPEVNINYLKEVSYMKKQLMYRAAAATVLGLSLTTGVAAAQTPYNHHKGNMPTNTSVTSSTVTNHNTVNATNTTSQVAQTGNAIVTDNGSSRHHDDSSTSSAPSATTGPATNNNALKNASVTVDTTASNADVNNMPSDTPADTGGSDHTSTQTVDTSTVSNTNNVNVTNSTNQYANTGNAVVAHNSTGGNATTGPATNNNTASFSVSVSD